MSADQEEIAASLAAAKEDEAEVAQQTAADHKAALAGHAKAVLTGTLLALVSAVLYTLTNMCLRAASKCDIYWVSCLKAVPTLLVAAAIVANRRRLGLPNYPGMRTMVTLVLTGLLAHIGGNAAFQYGLSVVGLAASVPLTFSMIIVGGSLLGRFYLGEAISVRSAAAMGLLCISIALLGLHTEHAKPSDALPRPDALTIAVAVGVTCFSGLAYAVLGVVIRRNVTGSVNSSVVLLIISISGIVSLGAITLGRIGLSGMTATTPDDLHAMLWAGTFNAGGFFLLTRALQLIPVAYVNVINASQTAMAAIAGVLYFHEPSTTALYGGVGLMTAGILLMDRPKHKA